MSDKKPAQTEALLGLIVNDTPVAIRKLYGAQASQTSFNKWRQGVTGPDGKKHKLPTYDIEGQGPSVIPSELRTFLRAIAHPIETNNPDNHE